MSNLVSYAFIWGKLLESHLMEETYSKWQVAKGLCLYKNSDPKGLSAPAQGGYILVEKHEKLCIKSGLKVMFLKLATNGQSDKDFLLTSGFCPQRVVCPCPGAIYMWKNIKNVYKIRIQRDLFETCNKWLSDINSCPQGVVCPCPGAINMYKSIKILSPIDCLPLPRLYIHMMKHEKNVF